MTKCLLLIVVVVLTSLSGCQEARVTLSPAESGEQSVASTSNAPATTGLVEIALTATTTASTVPTQSFRVTSTSTPILETPIPTRTYEQEPAVTNTPIPTIPIEDLESFILELQRGNLDCRLPCWWGAVPGKTAWREIQPFLASFADISSMPSSSGLYYFVEVFIPDRENPSIVYGGTYFVEDRIIVSIQTGASEETHEYFLTQLLNNYGEPDEVWLNTYDRMITGVLPFRLTLVYKMGFVITYELQKATEQSNFIVGCFDQIAPAIWVVPPARNITFEEAKQESAQVGADQYYLPLNEATDLTIGEFYELFKNPENSTCLETSAELWQP